MSKSLAKYVKYVYLYGQDKEYIENYIKDLCQYQICNDMKDAFRLASQKAQDSEIVLLSPACASFDEFSGYAERGEVFEKLVAELK